MTDIQRDQVIYDLLRRRYSYAKIARAVGAVRASLTPTAAKLGQGIRSDDWDADLP